MNDQEEKTSKETLRLEKLRAEEAESLAREEARIKISHAREQEIEKAQQLKEAKRAEERAREEVKELAKEKLRKEAYEAREKAIAENQEARRIKSKGRITGN